MSEGFTPEVEQQIAGMSEGDFSAFVSRVRAPDTAEQLRTAAAQHVPADQLDSIMGVIDPSKFLGDNGEINQTKVQQHFGTLFGSGDPPKQRDWGQGTGQPPGGRAGAGARAALETRHGVKNSSDAPAAGDQIRPGQSAREALAKRHPRGQR